MPPRSELTLVPWAARRIEPPGNVALFRRAVAASPGGVLLESVMRDRRWGRYSIFAIEPIRTLSVTAGSGVNPFARLAEACRSWGRFEPRPDLPFVGGWIGYLTYEAGRFIEPSAGFRTAPYGQGETPPGLTLSQWALFDTVLVHDQYAGSWMAAGVELPETVAGRPRPPLAERLRAVQSRARSFGEGPSTSWPSRPLPRGRGSDKDSDDSSEQERWNYSREEYLEKVDRALEYIRAGDIFQVNLTRRCRIGVTKAPFDIYERLGEANPATYAAYLPLAGPGGELAGAILSSSPELYLEVRQGQVTTRPIKGTRPRRGSPQADAEARRELAASMKDRAELNMIVDLERNDLGRVCEFGTVCVTSDGEIEELPTVFHRTATVTGRLREDADANDLLRATFPGGSITGAPKVRAMQIINELEPTPRGPYCGAVGYIGLDGDMMLNLPIRTMVVHDGGADVFVGSGIVADSVPEDEYDELQAKAAGMMAALKAARCEAAVTD